MGIGADATAGAADERRPKGETHRGYERQSQIEGPIEICNGKRCAFVSNCWIGWLYPVIFLIEGVLAPSSLSLLI